ncbi:hypothetical protein [Ekhidna sp.]|uniref:hypothetical protein n=1 Tax=Ekhidna sp. TaxID=2608089 RepID=UPI003514FB01
MRYHIAIFILLGLNIIGYSQDLETIKDQKFVTYSGGISFNNTFYHAIGMDSQRDPYFWQLNANLNFNFLNVVQVPFSLTLSQQQKNFNQPQPFNRFGLSPSYKSVTGHFGHRSMTFSQFTLAGTMFFGAGAEYTPKNLPWRASAMYGRLAKPVERFARDGLVFAEPTYRRIAYGVKTGYEKDDVSAHLILFKSTDDEHSINIPDSLDLKPEENLVLGFVTKFKFLSVFTFEVDYAHSMLTRDKTEIARTVDEFSFRDNLGSLFNANQSSSFKNAVSSKLTFNGNLFQLNLAYRRIDPEFTTHGSSFLNNDLEDISGGIALPFLQGKVSLSANAGIQRNNLDNQLAAQVSRFIFSSSASVALSERLNTSISYSNFSTDTRQSLIQEDLLSDTLEFFQVTRNGTLTANYSLGDSRQSNVFGTLSLQDATDSDGNQSTFTNANAGFSTVLNTVWRVNVSANFNKNNTMDAETTSFGPGVGIGRSLWENKVQMNLALNLFNSYLEGTLQSRIGTVRWTASSSMGKHHSISINAFYTDRKSVTEGGNESAKEMRGNINYAFRF